MFVIGGGLLRSPPIFLALTIAAAACGGSTAARRDDNRFPPPQVVINKYRGDEQTGVVGTSLADSLAIRLTSKYGFPASGQSVTWAAQGTNATISPRSNFTDDDGIAKARWTLGQTVGTQTATATVTSVANPVTFTAFSQAGAPNRLVKTGGDLQTGTITAVLGDSLVVQVTDAFTNPLDTIEVTFVVAGDSGSVSPAIVRTNAQGFAKARWTLGPAVPAQAIRATVPGLSAARFTAIVNLATVLAAWRDNRYRRASLGLAR
jgi:hypothetical protein